MPSLKKLLSKFGRDERLLIEFLIERIVSLRWRDLDIKKLKGYQNIFRVRKGKLRIIFSKTGNDILIFAIDRRDDNTYKF